MEESFLRDICILVVEDNRDDCALLELVLGRLGARVHTVQGVEDAAAVLASVEVDALVCDISLPDGTGYDLVGTLRASDAEEGKYVPAVAVTGWVRGSDRDRASRAGFDAFVAKPYTPDELLRALAAVAPLIETRRDARAVAKDEALVASDRPSPDESSR
jgi:two-component system, OmpR family, response regulator